MKQYNVRKLKDAFMNHLANATDIEKLKSSGHYMVACGLRIDKAARHVLAFIPVDIAVFIDHKPFSDVRPDDGDMVRFRISFEDFDNVDVVGALGMLLFDECRELGIPASFYYDKAGEFRELFNRIEAGVGEVNIYERVLFFSTVVLMIHDAAECEINAAGMAMLVPAVLWESGSTPGLFLKQAYENGSHKMNDSNKAEFMHALSLLLDTWGNDLKNACEAIAICYTTLGHRQSAIENGTWNKEPLKA